MTTTEISKTAPKTEPTITATRRDADLVGEGSLGFVADVEDGVNVVVVAENTEYCASNPRSSEEPERNFTSIWLPVEYTFRRAEPLQNRPSEEEFAEAPSYSST